MIFVTGDCHGDWRRFQPEIFYEQKDMTRDDYAIVLGDFGIWTDTLLEQMRLDRLSELPFTILFVDGNHENFNRLFGDEFKEIDWHGGKAKIIRENVLYLERGYVFDINGKKFFAFGGAASHDIQDGIVDTNGHTRHENGEDNGKYFKFVDKNFKDMKELMHAVHYDRKSVGYQIRINGVSWWEDEMPTDKDFARGIESLEKCGNKVDFIISHCAPQEIVSIMYRMNTESDPATRYFNTIAHTVTFDKWFFGHYHENLQIMSKYILLYDQIIQID